MRKWFFLTQFITPIVLAFLIISNCYAQSFFGATSPKNNGQPSAQPGKILSPDDFNKVVNNLSTETNSNLTQKMDQSLAKPLHPSSPPPTNPSPDQNAAASSVIEAAPLKNTTPPPMNTVPTNAAPPTSNTLPSTAAPNIPPTPIQPQQQSVPYTGFASPQPKNAAPTNSSSKSSGWNIKY